jgi:hypothetical protein
MRVQSSYTRIMASHVIAWLRSKSIFLSNINIFSYYIHQPNEFESSDAYLMLRLVKEAPESSYQISSVWLTICCYILDKCLY